MRLCFFLRDNINLLLVERWLIGAILLGVAVWYSGWLWTQQTSFLAFVDDRPDPVVLNLSDPDHVGDSLDAPSTPTKVVKILIARNLTESKHTVVLRKGDDQREVIVASFM